MTACLLPDVLFELINGGQTAGEMTAQAEADELNVRFPQRLFPAGRTDGNASRQHDHAQVFGASAKTNYVVPNKLYRGMALSRPVITAGSAAVREFMAPSKRLPDHRAARKCPALAKPSAPC
ncbi:MAG: hypothetical protein U0452_11980 [Anaerolineae bacterium]